MERPTLVVAIATYRRPHALQRLLALLPAQLADVHDLCDPWVLVVDNDPDGSARRVVCGGITYTAQPVPGIAATRNAALAAARDSDLLAFIDDDEVPRPGWLRALVRMWSDHTAAGVVAVAGPVRPRYEIEPRAWIADGPFHTSPDFDHGSERTHAATGNLLLDMGFVRDQALKFDDLGTRGGEDTRFTRELGKRGGRILWCCEAVADEIVPPGRSTTRWVVTRSMSQGNATGVMELGPRPTPTSRVRMTLLALLRVGGGGLRMAASFVRRRPAQFGEGVHTALRGVGFALAAADLVYDEYAREGRHWSRVSEPPVG